MAASNTDARSRTDRQGTGERTLSRYDLLLLVIPAAFLAALLVAQISSLSLPPVMAAASVVGALALADGLFVNPPQ